MIEPSLHERMMTKPEPDPLDEQLKKSPGYIPSPFENHPLSGKIKLDWKKMSDIGYQSANNKVLYYPGVKKIGTYDPVRAQAMNFGKPYHYAELPEFEPPTE